MILVAFATSLVVLLTGGIDMSLLYIYTVVSSMKIIKIQGETMKFL